VGKWGGTTDPLVALGAIGVWYADQYSSTTKAIPNKAAASQPSSNFLRAPRRLFSNASWWSGSGTTIVDDAVAGSDGIVDASTVVGTGNWLLRSAGSDAIPAGVYTVAVEAIRNTGSDQSFAFTPDNTSTRSAAKTATSAWQTFSYTFTLAAPSTINKLAVCSVDGSTGANIAIRDMRLSSGSADLGVEPLVGHLYLGTSQGDTKPSYSAGEVNLSTGGFGLVQFPAAITITSTGMTALALVSRVAAGSSYQAYLSKAQAYTTFSAYTSQNEAPADFAVTNFNVPGLWQTQGAGYHVFSHRYDGTNRDMFLDDIRAHRRAATVSDFSLRDLFVGMVNSSALTSGYKIVGIALFNKNLTDAELRQAAVILQTRAGVSGVTASNQSRILAFEGDSITGGFNYSWPYLYGPNASPSMFGANYAVSGSTIADMVARAATVDGVIPPNKGSRKFILSVLIGANDLATLGTSTWLTNLAAYLDARRAAGWIVVICTVLPRTIPTVKGSFSGTGRYNHRSR
jgi:hypothetical protein